MIIESVKDWIDNRLLPKYVSNIHSYFITIQRPCEDDSGLMNCNVLFRGNPGTGEILLDVNDPDMFNKLELFLVKMRVIK